jgi:Arc/MetJ-type ribon-helix-helix transcriptional regulator
MKERISVTLDKEIIRMLNSIVQKGGRRYRNKSHVVEMAIEELYRLENERYG